MNTDLPVTNVEQDKLGRAFLAIEIANGLVNSFANNTESIVIGINGTWGSGKSSLINFVVEEVERISKEKKRDIVVLRFNPWMFTGQTELQSIFFKELFIKLGSKKGLLKKASKKLASLIGYFNWLKYVHTGTGEMIKDSKEFLETFSKEKDLSDLKIELDDLLIKSGVKLYITIDDIDRLTPSEVTYIFQLVKLNGNFANTIFILAYDQEVVNSALQKQFGTNGKKYIEKIVQVDYTLPGIHKSDIINVFTETLESSFKYDKKVFDAIRSSFKDFDSESFTELLKTIRDIYRFVNALKLRLPSIYKELNIRDFFIIESLRVFRSDVYRFIDENKLSLTNEVRTNWISNLNRSSNTSPAKFIEEQKFDPVIKSLLLSIFSFDGSFNQFDPENLIREKRVANRTYFDRYFNLQLSTLDIPEDLIDGFLNDSDLTTRIEILREISKRGKLYQFLSFIEIRSRYLKKIDHYSFIESILRYTMELRYVHPTKLIVNDFYIALNHSSKTLEKVESLQRRRELIIKHASESLDNIRFSNMYICDSVLRSKQLLDEKKLNSSYKWFDLFSEDTKDNNEFEQVIKSLQTEGVKNFFMRVIQDPTLANEDELFVTLKELRNFHPELYRDEFQKFISDDQTLIKVLFICIVNRYISINGITSFRLAHEDFFEGIDVNRVNQRLAKIDVSILDENQRATIKFFQKAYEDGFQIDRYYQFYSLEEVALPDKISNAS